MSTPRISAQMYQELRAWMLANDPDAKRMLEWSNAGRNPPESSDQLAQEIIWVILCAGRKAQAARTIETKVLNALWDGSPVLKVFGHNGKAAAIERVWKDRLELYHDFLEVLAKNDPEAIVEWCGALDWVGDDTKFQLAKNFGIDVCKPDIWITRAAGVPDKPKKNLKTRFQACMALCRELSALSGDSIATIDSMLWLACNKGVLRVSPQAGPVTFEPKVITLQEIIPENTESCQNPVTE